MTSVFLLVIFVAYLSGTGQASPDPCRSYQEINDPHRSTGFRMGQSDLGMCDSNLSMGWYRFTSGAGGTIPEHCVHRFQCGTLMPIWMNGTHPSSSDGTVARTACVNFGDGSETAACCEHHITIGVKNCGNYFVYFLAPPQACPVAYCAGDKTRCRSGQWSATGFSPCTDTNTSSPSPSTQQNLCQGRNAGSYPYPGDCHKFVMCFSGRTFVESCPLGTAFLDTVHACVHAALAPACQN